MGPLAVGDRGVGGPEAQLEGTGGPEDSPESFLEEETPGPSPEDGERWEEEDGLGGRASWTEGVGGSDVGPLAP